MIIKSARPRRRTAAVVPFAMTLLLLMTACAPDSGGSDDDASAGDSGSTSSSEVNEAAREQLSQEIRDLGKLVVAVTPTYPPFEYLDDDGKTVIGQNAEVLAGAAARLGLEIEYQKVAQFGSVLTGIQAGRFAAGIIFTDTVEREGVVDIVSFYEDGVAVVGDVASGTSNDIACGTTVGVATGSLADVLKDELNEEICAGKEPMNYAFAAKSDLQFTALNSGRNDYILTSYGVGESLAKQSDGKFGPIAEPIFPAPTGIALNKDQEGLAEALTLVLADMKSDGTLAEIMDEWTTSDAMIDPGVNVAGEK